MMYTIIIQAVLSVSPVSYVSSAEGISRHGNMRVPAHVDHPIDCLDQSLAVSLLSMSQTVNLTRLCVNRHFIII